jgi:hypothetical protein
VIGDLPVGGWCVQAAEAEQGLEGGEWGAAAVVPEDELVEVDLEVLGRDAAVGALEPGLEIRDRSVGSWQHELLVGEALALLVDDWS